VRSSSDVALGSESAVAFASGCGRPVEWQIRESWAGGGGLRGDGRDRSAMARRSRRRRGRVLAGWEKPRPRAFINRPKRVLLELLDESRRSAPQLCSESIKRSKANPRTKWKTILADWFQSIRPLVIRQAHSSARNSSSKLYDGPADSARGKAATRAHQRLPAPSDGGHASFGKLRASGF